MLKTSITSLVKPINIFKSVNNKSTFNFNLIKKNFINNKRTVNSLPDKVGYQFHCEIDPSKVNKLIPSVNKDPSKCLDNLIVKWNLEPRTVLIVKKPLDRASDDALIQVTRWLKKHYSLTVIVEPHVPSHVISELDDVIQFNNDEIFSLGDKVDFVLTLGGDGSILHSASLFNGEAPPIIPFSMGTLGFLLPLDFDRYQYHLTEFLNGNSSILIRHRLKCEMEGDRKLEWHNLPTSSIHVLNEVIIHRGVYPNLTMIGCYVDNTLLTNSVADGLIIATPTGSTAYSLSAGGPIVHPKVECVMITPICPRSLSFRPILLPIHSNLNFKLDPRCRSHAQISLDGRDVGNLSFETNLKVMPSEYPIYTVNLNKEGKDFNQDINSLLKFNQNFTSQ